MGLFDSAIQNLSKMALHENGLDIPQVASPALVDEFQAILDQIPSLTEAEMEFPVYAVPLKENTRLGRYLIEMEDLSRYMMTNGITNVLEAVTNIGNYNGTILNSTNTALVIDEASILQEMDDLGMNIGGSNSNEGNIGTVGLLGPHTDLGKFRRFANSREFIDTVCNKYGLPLVKKNYTIGLVKVKHGNIEHNGNVQESAAEYQATKKGASDILQEKKPGTNKVLPKQGDIGDTSMNETTLSDFKSKLPSSSPTPRPTMNYVQDGNVVSSRQFFADSRFNGGKTASLGAKASAPIKTNYTGDGSTASYNWKNSPERAALGQQENSYKKFLPSGQTNAQIASQEKTDAAAQAKLAELNRRDLGSVAAGSGRSISKPSVTHASTQPDDNLQYLRDIALGKYDSELLNESYGIKS